MAPLAMAARLLFADPRQTLILTIDDAHTLSHASLAYLAEMTDLLATDPPVLQIVLTANPVLLDTLARPEFEGFRNRLVRPRFEALPTAPRNEANVPTHGVEPMAPSWIHRVARPAFHAAAGLVAVGCLAAIGYIALPASAPKPAAPADPSLSMGQREPRQSYQVVGLADAVVATGSVDPLSALLARIANFKARPPSEGPDGGSVNEPSQHTEAAGQTTIAPGGSAFSARLDAGAPRDRAAQSPNAAQPTPLSAAPDQADGARPAAIAKASPAAAEGAAAPAPEQTAAASQAVETMTSIVAAPAPPSAAQDQDAGRAQAATGTGTDAAAPDNASSPSAELTVAGSGDQAAS
ncbi:MAG TPA: hypothetical protein VEH77_14015, partial [Roseiarcus sp.]|nr:hypothetical protein [Roseiarcus sp.]